LIDFRNVDCMELMKEFDDNHFDLAIVDPPYGIGADKQSVKPKMCKQKNGTFLQVSNTNSYTQKDWDDSIPSDEYFEELKRVSKNQIIWGVNYFKNLQGGRIVWNKMNGESDQYGCEIAYCSFNNRTDVVNYMWCGMIQGNSASKNTTVANYQQGNKALNEKRIHPTQKPVKLYAWLLQNYAKEGDKILDTMVGSASSLIACHNLGFKVVGCELDTEYYNLAQQRIKEETAQLSFI